MGLQKKQSIHSTQVSEENTGQQENNIFYLGLEGARVVVFHLMLCSGKGIN